jgi:hypothetical protein
MRSTNNGDTIMITVSKEQFYSIMGKLDVHPHLIGSYPYQENWKLRNGNIVGWSQGNEYKIIKELA